ncbi:hypothetical protein [Nostoc sp.]
MAAKTWIKLFSTPSRVHKKAIAPLNQSAIAIYVSIGADTLPI